MVGLLALGAGACDRETVTPTTVDLRVEPPALAFADTVVGGQREASVVLENRGTRAAEGTIELSSDAFRLVQSSAGFTLDAGDAQTWVVRFVPLVDGDHEATLRFLAADATGPEVDVALTGRGVPVPFCDDQNECTDDVYDIENERCAFVFHQRSCTTDNACLVNPSCHLGICVGEPRACPDAASPCQESVCLPDAGCIERDIPAFCDDGDPCTDDVCTVTGCAHPAADNGTVCREAEGCTSFGICQQGDCIDIPVPDGAPCDDGAFCTTDACQGGVCVGTYVPGEPTIADEIHQPMGDIRFVSELGDAAVLVASRNDPDHLLSTSVLRRTSTGTWERVTVEGLSGSKWMRAVPISDELLLLVAPDELGVFVFDPAALAVTEVGRHPFDFPDQQIDGVAAGVAYGRTFDNEPAGFAVDLLGQWGGAVASDFVGGTYVHDTGLRFRAWFNEVEVWNLLNPHAPTVTVFDAATVGVTSPAVWAGSRAAGFFDPAGQPTIWLFDPSDWTVEEIAAPVEVAAVEVSGTRIYVAGYDALAGEVWARDLADVSPTWMRVAEHVRPPFAILGHRLLWEDGAQALGARLRPLDGGQVFLHGLLGVPHASTTRLLLTTRRQAERRSLSALDQLTHQSFLPLWGELGMVTFPGPGGVAPVHPAQGAAWLEDDEDTMVVHLSEQAAPTGVGWFAFPSDDDWAPGQRSCSSTASGALCVYKSAQTDEIRLARFDVPVFAGDQIGLQDPDPVPPTYDLSLGVQGSPGVQPGTRPVSALAQHQDRGALAVRTDAGTTRVVVFEPLVSTPAFVESFDLLGDTPIGIALDEESVAVLSRSLGALTLSVRALMDGNPEDFDLGPVLQDASLDVLANATVLGYQDRLLALGLDDALVYLDVSSGAVELAYILPLPGHVAHSTQSGGPVYLTTENNALLDIRPPCPGP